MGKYKKRYRALKDDVSDLMIAVGTEDFEKYDETVEIILTYYYTTDEASNLVKHIDDINAKKGKEDN